MGLDARKPDFVACEQRHRPACAAAQADQCLCSSLSESIIANFTAYKFSRF